MKIIHYIKYIFNILFNICRVIYYKIYHNIAIICFSRLQSYNEITDHVIVFIHDK